MPIAVKLFCLHWDFAVLHICGTSFNADHFDLAAFSIFDKPWPPRTDDTFGQNQSLPHNSKTA